MLSPATAPAADPVRRRMAAATFLDHHACARCSSGRGCASHKVGCSVPEGPGALPAAVEQWIGCAGSNALGSTQSQNAAEGRRRRKRRERAAGRAAHERFLRDAPSSRRARSARTGGTPQARRRLARRCPHRLRSGPSARARRLRRSGSVRRAVRVRGPRGRPDAAVRVLDGHWVCARPHAEESAPKTAPIWSTRLVARGDLAYLRTCDDVSKRVRPYGYVANVACAAPVPDVSWVCTRSDGVIEQQLVGGAERDRAVQACGARPPPLQATASAAKATGASAHRDARQRLRR